MKFLIILILEAVLKNYKIIVKCLKLLMQNYVESFFTKYFSGFCYFKYRLRILVKP